MFKAKSELGSSVRGQRSPKGSTLPKTEHGQQVPTCDALQKLAIGFAVAIRYSDSSNAEGPAHAIL
jgi:hypothetical protein